MIFGNKCYLLLVTGVITFGSLSTSLSQPLDEDDSLLSNDELDSPISSGPDVSDDESDDPWTSCDDCDLIIVFRIFDSSPSL